MQAAITIIEDLQQNTPVRVILAAGVYSEAVVLRCVQYR